MLLPLHPQVIACVDMLPEYSSSLDAQLAKSMLYLRAQQFHELGLPVYEYPQLLESRTSRDAQFTELGSVKATWHSAITELTSLNLATLPSEQLGVILRAARNIYQCHKEYLEEAERHTAQYELQTGTPFTQKIDVPKELGADDFLPIFVHCLIQSGVEQPLLIKELLWRLADPDLLRGESGYYLTVFEAALEHIRNMVGLQSDEMIGKEPTKSCETA